MKKNWFLTFCCACVPGFGQMYQGYMRRGVSLALWFWGFIFIAATLSLGVLAIFLPVIWAYAFFDTFNIRGLSPEQRAVFIDDFIPNSHWLKAHNMDRMLKKGEGNKVVAWGLIILGIMIFYSNIVSRLYGFLWEYIPILARVLDGIIPFSVGAAVIFIGIRMLQGRGTKPKNDEDIELFKGDENRE